jgi:Xaa-Pro aminopeptidase
MRSDPLPPDLFARNRSRLSRLLPDGGVALLCAASHMPRNADQYHPYRQNSDFFYLTGIPVEACVLVLSPESETLFIPKADPKKELWDGPLLTPGQASELSGIENIRWTDELDPLLEELAGRAASFCLNQPANPLHWSRIRTPDADLQEKLDRAWPEMGRSPLAPLLAKLRMIKEQEEVAAIRKACSITRSAFLRALKSVRPGIKEYEAEAELEAEFVRQGAGGHAFEPTLASGSNALILHYNANSGTCAAGDLLLMDFGAEVNNYASDCTRTVPVNGTFTRRQRAVYDAAYRVFLQARELMVPGTGIDDYHLQVGKLWEEEHIALGLYSRREAKERSGPDALWKRYFMHGTSHSLGLDVHDPFLRTEPFQAGMVLTCEPAIYIPEEGMGIRLENDILITEKGPVDLMEDIPMAPQEIENLMKTHMRKGSKT